jgi:hypothetical protein
MSILSAAVLMFIVLDPLGNVPFFVATMQRMAPERRLLVTVRELLIALAVLVTFLFVGQYILHLLQLTSIIALRMIFPRPDAHANYLEGEPFAEIRKPPSALDSIARVVRGTRSTLGASGTFHQRKPQRGFTFAGRPRGKTSLGLVCHPPIKQSNRSSCLNEWEGPKAHPQG